MKATIRLFKAVPISDKNSVGITTNKILKKTIKRGFVFSPNVIGNYSQNQLENIITDVENEIGLTPKKMNQTLHKSWYKVANVSDEQLFIEQILHYITTYGFEAMGIYDEDSVYIPTEKLKIPKIKVDKVPLTVISGMTKDELKIDLLNLLSKGIALSTQSIDDCVDIGYFVNINGNEIETIKNKEVKVALYDKCNYVPSDPTEFLRYVIYKLTGNTLLIKNRQTIQNIQETSDRKVAARLFDMYSNLHGIGKIAQIFYRFKPLFLAIKKLDRMSSTINTIRRLAKINHKPMSSDYLNNITSMIKQGKNIDDKHLIKELNKVNVFRKIRLMYALKYRTNVKAESIMYKVRNGSSYAKEFNFNNTQEARLVMNIVLDSIIKDLRKNVEGKTILIPKNMKYALPATEKQFTGDIPSGSYISVPKDMVVGVQWHNLKNQRVDLDLSMINETAKIGWDGDYKTNKCDVLFSGDLTSAPGKNGASELFYIQNHSPNNYILILNLFNQNDFKDPDVPFKIVVAKKKNQEFKRNFMIDPNNVVCISSSSIGKAQKTIGLVKVTKKNCKFYFSETTGVKAISNYWNTSSQHCLNYFIDYFSNPIILNNVLKEAGANVVSKIEKDQEIDVDLSPENVRKDTIINLIA